MHRNTSMTSPPLRIAAALLGVLLLAACQLPWFGRGTGDPASARAGDQPATAPVPAPQSAPAANRNPAPRVRETQIAKVQPAPAPRAEPTFNFDGLIERLKQTDAIGTITKLVLKSDADDLLEYAAGYRRSKSPTQLSTLRARYDGLILKVVTLLEKDPTLATDIYRAREQVWLHLLEDKA